MNYDSFTYEAMISEVKALKMEFPYLETGSIGTSVLGRELIYLRIGQGKHEVFINAAHHSLEWITSCLLMKFARKFLTAYDSKKLIMRYSTFNIWNNSSVYIVPMVNPDGVNLVLNGLSADNPYYNYLLSWNNGNSDFSTNWQSNIRGVDLNHNYNASWLKAKAAEPENEILGPGPTRYSGSYPESEPETKAVANFTRQHEFKLVLAYHSQGREIFWDYGNLTPAISIKIARLFARASGYTVGRPSGMASFSGYKDWFIETYRRPGFTIEVGHGKNPLPVSQLEEIYKDNEELLLLSCFI